MLRLQTALASSSEESARVYDESDERRREQYEVVTIHRRRTPRTSSNAWSISDKAFGAELAGADDTSGTINLGFTRASRRTAPHRR